VALARRIHDADMDTLVQARADFDNLLQRLPDQP
jgi:hypothetical protein